MGMPGGMEWILIALVVLLLFGGKKIPELMKGLGSGIKNFKKAVKDDDESEIVKSDEIEKLIEKILERDLVLEKPKDISLGHYATPVAFSLAKELRKNPMMIAEDLAAKFDNIDMFESVTAVKGFVNFKLSKDFLYDLTNKALDKALDFAKSDLKKEKYY